MTPYNMIYIDIANIGIHLLRFHHTFQFLQEIYLLLESF